MVTAGSEESAARIARTLVEERFCACVNLLGPIRSIYRWRGRIEDTGEHLMLIKTAAARYPALQKRILELHPYNVPEVIALAPGSGNPRYLAWVQEETAPRAKPTHSAPAGRRARGRRIKGKSADRSDATGRRS